ncbi:MAG: desulfoferrodoxin [archaeon]
MTTLNQVWKCEVCGNIIEVLHEGANSLVCCNQPMVFQKEKLKELEGNEKHIPVIEKTEEGIKVNVGSVEHPMTDEHYIEWIEVISGEKILKKFLKPRDKPFAEFCVEEENIIARAYCNLHSLWKS